ncbi:hypothetical protein PCASD_15478 [Puccinia coronata f. sp. avenae]|uniref:Aminotransferase class I/classII large domain-containing protein n=1 Tax=Puccinia coronata f. sp. avenae TaxID=200324 RepID=A0A2N5TZG4_9BASI|nr:hypothetical protein PCASD_15478 [Puccinia coronata f. sp. avenae]
MKPSNLSRRSTQQLTGKTNAIAKATADAWKDIYSADQNPNGVINLGVAENSLMQDVMVKRLKGKFSRLEPQLLNYQSLGGSRPFKEAMCRILNQYFNTALPVAPEHILCASGVTAAISQLMYVICDEGEGVLISKPYYSGFNHLIKQGVHLLGFDIENPLDSGSVSNSLNKAYQDYKGQPHKITSVILCNPHNPMGYYVQEEVLAAYMGFCEAHDLHLVVDEIYALSVFEEGPPSVDEDGLKAAPSKFTSALSLDHHRFCFDPSRLHVLYGISKDFGCCGLRAGVLISQHNPDLLKLIIDLNLNHVQVSSLSEFCFSQVILNTQNDQHPEFLDSYVLENKKRLLNAHQRVVEKLKSLGISHNTPANAGFFLMIDMSKYLSGASNPINKEEGSDKEGSQAEEEKLLTRLLKEYKIYISPGSAYNYPKPGFFRLTFAVPPDQLDLGLQRLARFIRDFEGIPPIADLSISRRKK